MGFCWQSFVFEDLGGGLANAWKPLDVSQSFIRSNNKKTTWVGVYYFEVKLQTQKKDVLLLLYTKLNVVTSTPPTLRRPVTNDYRAHQQRPKRRVLPPHARQFPPKTFSDWFEPRCAADYQFQLIGTAASPLVGKAVGRNRKAYLKNVEEYDKNRIVKFRIGPLPISKNLALPWLITLVRVAYSKTLRRAPEGDFKRGWCSVALLYSGLDLDSALEHEAKTADGMENWLEVRSARHWVNRCVLCPKRLAGTSGAWRRFEVAELTDEEFHCSEAITETVSPRKCPDNVCVRLL